MLASTENKASTKFAARALRHTLLALAAALSVWTLQTGTARASTTIGADLDLHVPLQINEVNTGGGFGIRLGQELHLPLVSVNPEIGFNYVSFSKEDSPKLYRVIAGARLGFGELMRFGVMAHVGFGHVSWEPAPDNYSHSGLTYDAGMFIELTALPLLNVGLHGAYNRMAGEDDQPDTLHWLTFGLHATLVL